MTEANMKRIKYIVICKHWQLQNIVQTCANYVQGHQTDVKKRDGFGVLFWWVFFRFL